MCIRAPVAGIILQQGFLEAALAVRVLWKKHISENLFLFQASERRVADEAELHEQKNLPFFVNEAARFGFFIFFILALPSVNVAYERRLGATDKQLSIQVV